MLAFDTAMAHFAAAIDTLMKRGCYQAVLTRAGRLPSTYSEVVDASGSG